MDEPVVFAAAVASWNYGLGVTTRPPLLRPGLGINAPAGGYVGARHASPIWRGPRNACIWRLGSPNVRAAHAPPLQPVGA